MDLRVTFTLVVLVGAALADHGEYEPKSFYLIDRNGQKSDLVYVRDRRDLERKLQRFRRGVGSGGYSSSQSYSSGSASSSASASGGSDGGAGINYASGFHPSNVLSELHNLASNFPAAGFSGIPNIGARSGGFSDGSSDYGSSGYTSGQQSGYTGGQGSGQQTGYNGPILFSRSGETEGTGVRATGAAAGPNAAFSSVSTSSGGGKVTYDVKSGKY